MFFLFYNCTFYACLNVLVLAFTCLFMYIRTCLYTIFYINIVFILVNIYMSKTFFSIHLSLYTSLLILVCAIVYASLFFDYTFLSLSIIRSLSTFWFLLCIYFGNFRCICQCYLLIPLSFITAKNTVVLPNFHIRKLDGIMVFCVAHTAMILLL